MPRVKLSVGFSDIKGVQQGSVWSQNGGGLYFRTNHYYGKKQTVSQSVKRNALARVAGLWRLLGDANQNTWIVAAPNFPTTNIFGDPRIPTGYELFMRMNLSLYNSGQTLISTAPSVESLPDYGPIVLTAASPSQFTIGLTNVLPSGWYLEIYATRSMSPGVKKIPTNWKQLIVVDLAGSNSYNAASEYIAKFGNPVTDQLVWVWTRAIFVSKGIVGADSYSNVIATAF